MWMISNFRANASLALLLFITLMSSVMAADNNSDDKVSFGKLPIIIKQVNLVTLDKATLVQVLGRSELPFEGKVYVIKVETEKAVDLTLSSSPMILINGQASITRFAPYQASTFYAFVPASKVKKGNNAISMVWPDKPTSMAVASMVTIKIE
jgi:hypothetical protein